MEFSSRPVDRLGRARPAQVLLGGLLCPAPYGSAAWARPRAGPGTELRATTTHKTAKTSASGPNMKFSQRLCEIKLGRAPIAMATAINQVPRAVEDPVSLGAPDTRTAEHDQRSGDVDHGGDGACSSLGSRKM